jgi:hypothetical protein
LTDAVVWQGFAIDARQISNPRIGVAIGRWWRIE